MQQRNIAALLNIEHPVLQGGMAWIADARLASAVSEAGGLGVLSVGGTDVEALRAEIRKVRTMTDKPFGVNLMLMNPEVDRMAEVVAEERVPVVTTGAGNPAKYMQAWREAGIRVFPVVASVAFARLMERVGAQAVIAEGGEAGGHIGDSTTMTLVPQVCDAVRIPVIAAGGIGDGRGMAAAMMLGASGVQLGTRLLVADECCVHDTYKDRLIRASDTATTVTGRRKGHPIRTLKSPAARRYAQMEAEEGIDAYELSALRAGALRKAVETGDEQEGYFMAGQIAGMLQRRESVYDIITSMVQEAKELCERGCSW